MLDISDEPLPPSDEPVFDEPAPPVMHPALVDDAEPIAPPRATRTVGSGPRSPITMTTRVEEMEALLVPPQPTPQELKLQGDKDALLMRAAALQVVDAASYEQAIELGQVLTGFVKDAGEYFDPDVNRAYTLWNSLTTKRKAFIDPLKEGIEKLKTRAVSWFQNEEARRRENQRIADAEAARLAREEADRKVVEAERARQQGDVETARELVQEAEEIRQSPPPPAAPVPSAAPKVAGAGVKANWVHEVYDFKALVQAVGEGKVSIEALQPNDTYLRSRAKADKKTLNIPGVRVYDKGSMALKAR